jgi:hypothetical protein
VLWRGLGVWGRFFFSGALLALYVFGNKGHTLKAAFGVFRLFFSSSAFAFALFFLGFFGGWMEGGK